MNILEVLSSIARPARIGVGIGLVLSAITTYAPLALMVPSLLMAVLGTALLAIGLLLLSGLVHRQEVS